jgi:hypothetical protein
MFGMISQAAPNVCTYMCRESDVSVYLYKAVLGEAA